MKPGLSLLLVSVFAAFSSRARTAETAIYTSPLSTGLRLDPIGEAIDVGNMPLSMAVAPDGRHVALVLSGWREQGLQIVDLQSRRVVQTLPQDAAFEGVAFARNGSELYVSGGNDDSIFCYSWNNGAATFEHKIRLADGDPKKPGQRYPAGLAVSRTGNYLYVAENESDSVAVVDPVSLRVVKRFPTDRYPYAVEAAGNGKVYVSAWGADTLSIFDVDAGGMLRPSGKLNVGPRPSALASNASGTRLFIALATSDRIVVVDTRQKKVLRTLSDAAPSGPSEGSTPNALALSADGTRLFVAEADNNAVAVFDLRKKTPRLEGRVPVDWYPAGVVDSHGRLLVLNAKGHGSHANPDGPTPGQRITRPLGYDLGQLSGTLRICPDQWSPAGLALDSRRVADANGWAGTRSTKRYPPFKHVLYIIKENRTYDQVLGDLKQGDGDPSLVFFGQPVSPNHHALALRFGLFDRFFTNAEVSSQGHIWSTAAYVTDYGEKLIPSLYSDRRADLDGEDDDEPLNGFLWSMAREKHVSFRDYGEMVNDPKSDITWPVTQRDLRGNICPTYPPFNLKISDQVRADAWIAELETFTREGRMPSLEVMHLPGDHTAGGRPGYLTPRAYMADNDLALGRIAEALTKSPFWRDTVVFVLEDDAQAGPDHVDCHRAPFYVISAYNRPGTIHRFVNTTDVVAAIEDILGLDRLSKYDYFSRSLADVFADSPDLSPYEALVPDVDIKEANPAQGAAAQMSEGLDLSGPDRVDDQTFNAILWQMMKGPAPLPAPRGNAPLQLFQMAR